MSSSHTQSRVLQWIGIIIALLVVGGAYWYFQVRASTLNQSKNDLVTNGLVALWSFNGDDISGTTAYDRSGNANNGTLTGGPTKVMGKIGQALNFDGTNDEITTATSQGTASTLKTLTLSVWFKTSSASGKNLIGMEDAQTGTGSSAYDRKMWMGSDGKVRFGMYTTTSYIATSLATLNDGLWHHAVGVSTGDNGVVSLYIDGVLQETTSVTGTVYTYSGTSYWRMGSYKNSGTWPNSSDGYYTGQLDEVRVYNRAITVGEVQSLYTQGGGTKVDSAVSQPQGTGRLDSGLAGYWAMDNGSGTSATDSSTNGNTGTLTNGPTWTTGQIGSAVNFDGGNDHIDVGSSATLQSSEFTYAAWINPTGATIRTIKGNNSSGGPQFRLTSGGALELLKQSVGSIATTTPSVTNGVWSHVAITYDSGGRYAFYINGISVGSGTSGQSFSFSSVQIGIRDAGSGGAEPFSGAIDEFRMYDRVLLADEVAQLYSLTTPTSVDTSLKGYWSFNGQDMNGNTAYDRSGARNTGTLTGGPVKTMGVVGQGVDFDGSNDYVSVADANVLDGFSDLSLSGWFYRDTFTTDDTLIGKKNSSATGDVGYILYIDATTDQLIFKVSDGTNEYSLTSKTTFTATGWNFFVVTFSGTGPGNSRIYINGLDNNATHNSGTWSISDDPTNALVLALGAESDAGGPFDGKLDEVRFYAGVLTAAQVKVQYDASAPDKGNSSVSQPQGTGQLDSGLAGYWKMDENTGATVGDSSPNANAGTRTCEGGLCSSPAWTTGQIGTALDFNGTNNYVNVSDANTLDFVDSTNFSLSGWFNRDTFTTDDMIVSKRVVSIGNTGYVVYIDDATDKLTFNAHDGTDSYQLESATTFTATGWNHYAIVWDDSGSGQTKLYINGIAEAATATGTFGNVNSLANTSLLRIGATTDGLDAVSSPFDGKIDEVRLYNRAVSAEEVVQLYRLATPSGTDTSLKGYWSFNGQDMNSTAAYDRSGAGNTGTLTGGPTKVPGKIGQATSFDGTNDYVTMGDIASMEGGTQLTVSVWMKQNGATNERHIIDKSGCNGTSGSWEMMVISGEPVFGTIYSSGNYDFPTGTGYNVSDNQWHHLVGTYNGVTISLYVDGALAATATDTRAMMSDSSSVEIGGNCNGAGSCSGSCSWNGQVDEARVYNRQFSADEVATLYNQSR